MLVSVLLLASACSQSSPTAQTQSAGSGSDQKGDCPITQSQVQKALGTPTQPPSSNAAAGDLCTFRTDATDPYSMGVTIQTFPLADQPAQTLDAAYTQLNQMGTDQLTKQPDWGDGAFFDTQSLPNLGVNLYIGWIPGYEVQLNLKASDQARVADAQQIMAELVGDVGA